MPQIQGWYRCRRFPDCFMVKIIVWPLGQQPGRYTGVKFLTFHQSKGLQAEAAILCGDCRYDLNHRFRNAVYKSSGLFSQTYD